MDLWELPIYVNGRVFLIDLICLPYKKIDVVLGMDWLSYNYVYIGYKEKSIFIPAKEETLNDVITSLLEDTINMIHCHFEQDKAFLFILTIDSNEKKDTLKIAVVCKFPYVFMKDVTSLPP